MKNIFLSISLCITSVYSVFSQSQTAAQNRQYTFYSDVFKTERSITVSVPERYELDSTSSYITAYLFDGQFEPYIALTTATSDFYMKVGESIPMIIVAISSQNRMLEFTPRLKDETKALKNQDRMGKADLLRAHLQEEVFPMVDSIYRTKAYRLGIGHSLGGTFLLYDYFKGNGLFQSIIAASPNLEYDDEQLVQAGKEYLSHAPNKNTFIYTSAGDQGDMENSFRKSLLHLDSIVRKNKPSGLIWNCQLLANTKHISSFLPTLDAGLQAFSTKWILSDEKLLALAEDQTLPIVQDVETFYKELSTFSGIAVEATVDDWNSLAYSLSYEELYAEALELLNHAIAKYPTTANLYDSKGEMLENQKKYSEARSNYQKSMDLLITQKDQLSPEDYEYYFSGTQKKLNRLNDKFIHYKELIQAGSIEIENKNYAKASAAFKEAFTLDIVKGTHIDRALACIAFAQNGDIEDAFKQLTMLSDLFKWKGAEQFIDDERYSPLHADDRWKKFITAIE